MIFGAHAINVREFIDCLFEMVPVDRFIRKDMEAKEKDRNTEKAIRLLKSILKKTDKKNFPATSLIADEMRRRDPEFSIKSLGPAGRPLHIHICIHAAMIYLMSIRRKARIAAPGALPYGGHPFVIQ